ncbi:MAG TPA: polysaccharide biosynthesis tyrosine autokinase [Devosiaceae bacterium]|nr:polysaccharide biosynthesis tyrosine autokinase [Devosiaceae bacterium]
MLRRNSNSDSFSHGDLPDVEGGESDVINLDRVAGIIRRQWKVVLAVTVVGTLVGVTYLWFATPLYKASSELLIDQNDAGLTVQVTGNTDASQADAAIMSQVELFGSANVAGMAVDKLNLTADKAFMKSGGLNLKSQILGLFKPIMAPFQHAKASDNKAGRLPVPASTPRDAAVNIIQANTNITRVRGTYLLEVDYLDPDPVRATNIANALAAGYLSDQLDSQYAATRSASDWLQQRIDQLSKESVAADTAVQQFRSANNLQLANGQLITDQQVSQLNSSLITAQNATTAAKAKLDQIDSILAANDPNALVTAALDSPLINDLRQRYLETAKRESDFEALVGDQHLQVLRLKSEMAEYQSQIKEELQRIAEGYQSDYQIALAHEQSQRAALDQATKSNPTSNALMAKLNELQLQSDSVKSLYQSFLQNYQAASQRASFPMAGARIVTPASVPSSPAQPIGWLILAASTFLGGLVGVGVGGTREFRDRFVRTVDHLRSDVGLEYLGMVPLLDEGPKKRGQGGPLLPNQVAPLAGSLFNYAIEHRRSQFTETLRSAKVASDLALADSKSKVLGMISLLPEEGKTTLSYNFASLIASTGARTLIIDADLRRPSLSRHAAPHCKAGLIETVLRKVSFEDALFPDPATGLDVLPISLSTAALNSSDLLGSAAFAMLLEAARRHYEYIILDLPPVAAVVDARAVSPQVDAFVLVVQWGSTSRQFLQSTLNAEPRIAEKCVGTILNKADIKKLQLYRTPGSSEAYLHEYSSYFREGSG